MGLFERTLGQFFKATNIATMPMLPSGVAAFPNHNFESLVKEGYMKNELVYACVEEWATDIAEADIKAYNNDADGNSEEVPNHPAVILLNNPNPFMSGDDLASIIQMFKRLCGNSFTLKIRSGAQKVVQLWPLRPDRVRIVPSAQEYISHYEYRIGAEKFDIDARDIVHHKMRHPYDDYYGMPPLMAAAGRTDIDNFMRDVVKGFLENSGMPAGILQVAGKLSEGEKQLFRMRFRTDFGGRNAGNIIVSDGGSEAPKYTPIGMPLGTRGLVIPELNDIDEVRIPMVFHVPGSLLGTRMGQQSSSYANRVSDREFFTEQQLVPEWKSIAGAWTTQMLAQDFVGAEYLMHDLTTVRALGEDQNELAKRLAGDVAATILSIEEGRQAKGLPDPDPKHHFLVPFNMTIKTWDEIMNPPEIEPLQSRAPVIGIEDSDETNPDGLPQLPAQKRLLAPQVVVVNANNKDVKKVFEYDDQDRIIGVTESVVD